MATLTITVGDSAVPRIQAAVGRALGLGRAATTAEVQQFIKDDLKQVVIDDERRRQQAQVTDTSVTTVTTEFGA